MRIPTSSVSAVIETLRAEIGREQVRVFPGREVIALVNLVFCGFNSQSNLMVAPIVLDLTGPAGTREFVAALLEG